MTVYSIDYEGIGGDITRNFGADVDSAEANFDATVAGQKRRIAADSLPSVYRVTLFASDIDGSRVLLSWEDRY